MKALNESLETKCRGMYPLADTEGFGCPLHARGSGSATVAQVNRSDAA